MLFELLLQHANHAHNSPPALSPSRVIMRPFQECFARKLLSERVELRHQAQSDRVADAAVIEHFVAPRSDDFVREGPPEESVSPRVVLGPRARLPHFQRRPQAPQARDRPTSRSTLQRLSHRAGDGRRLLHPGAAQREHVALAVEAARVPCLPGPVVENDVQAPDRDLQQQPEDALQHRAGLLPFRPVPPRVVVVPH